MDWQTFLNIALAILAGVLGVKNWQMNQRREDRRESEEFTEIRVQYNQVMDMLHDLQKDMRSVSVISERVVVIETNVAEIYRRIEKLEGKYGE
ncbi:MAG: hypothetical protein J6Y95_06770 [Lachnospiraceae bacterium]|nr:hypothetical protein [Lachnospiraceae bacterium]